MALRPGCDELLRASAARGAPFVVCSAGLGNVVRALLNAGADKTIAANNGYKPIDFVCIGTGNKQHKNAIVALLR